MAKRSLAFLFLAIFSFATLACTSQSSRPSFIVSDGVRGVRQQPFIRLNSLVSSDSSCDETYGFLPCTTTLLGNVFLIVVYGYIMFLGDKLLSGGSEILLQILGPGIVGGLLLPVLGSVPDAAIILASGLSGSKETAQSQVSVGMGLMAGSNVMLLTILWASCLVVGKCDIEGCVAVDSKDTRTFTLIGSGVTTDIWTSYAARIMVISLIPLIMVQLPVILNISSGSQLAILLSLSASICFVLCYFLYQILQPWIQKRKIEYAKHKNIMSGVLKQLKIRALGRLLTDNGRPNRDVIQKLFKRIDENSDGFLSASELRALVIGIQFEDMDVDITKAVDEVLKDFDTNGDLRVDVDEFFHGISKWLDKARHSALHPNGFRSNTNKLLADLDEEARREQGKLGDQNSEEGGEGGLGNSKWNVIKAILMLVLGTVVAAVFAEPLVDSVNDFSSASSIPTFFVSFVILPFASSSEVVSVLIFASRKQSKALSLAYSEIYGSVTMSNTLSLAVFLGLVYFRGLRWSFGGEVLVILIACIVMGLIASFRTTFPLWISLVAFALYPFSLLLAYILDYILGWG